MNNLEVAGDLLFQAGERLRAARTARKRGNHSFTVRLSQECVELSLKAVLIYSGIEVPKWHDVGPVLLEQKSRFPLGFRRSIPKIATISRTLRREREPSMYGDEATGLPPGKIYDG